MDKSKTQRGQALVEFALILPLLLMVVCAILQFGLVFHAYLTVNEAAREGARLAAVGGTDTAIEARVKEVAPALKPDSLTITINPKPIRVAETMVTVTVSTPPPASLPFMDAFLPASLQGRVAMRVENGTP